MPMLLTTTAGLALFPYSWYKILYLGNFGNCLPNWKLYFAANNITRNTLNILVNNH